jgi:trans-aconitate 2-methyltransferase
LSWSAKQYVAFEDERTRPVRDLLAALPPIEARTVIDLGCGPGNSTEVLAALYPRATVSGIDSSPDMVAAARQRMPQVAFSVASVQAWSGDAAYDVILANAVLQWVPDHRTLLPALMQRVAAGGALAVQMPDNLDVPAHRLMREVAGAGAWAGKLAQASEAREPLAAAEWYFQLLRTLGSKVDIWRTTYYHLLAGGAAAVVEWFKGSGLRPYLEPLNEGERSAFLKTYTAAIAHAYPPLADGSVLLPFPRLFFTAQR